MRSDRVLHRAVPPRLPHTQGRPPRHGGGFVFGQPDTWGTPGTETVTNTRLYSTARARSWDAFPYRVIADALGVSISTVQDIERGYWSSGKDRPGTGQWKRAAAWRNGQGRRSVRAG
jgi:hypothetical protein